MNIEPHGYFTTKPEFVGRMLEFGDLPYLRLNMDTGNTFIAGQDPVAFLSRFIGRLGHVHVKDVSASLAAATRGKQAGIAISHCALGRRRQRGEHQNVPGPAARPRLPRRAEHGMRGRRRPDDRTLAPVAPRGSRGIRDWGLGAVLRCPIVVRAVTYR